MNNIETWFLILSLFLPRLALVIAYLSNAIPANTIPFWGDFAMAALIPRVLILIYIITNMGFGGWAVAHLIFCILSYTVSISKTTKK